MIPTILSRITTISKLIGQRDQQHDSPIVGIVVTISPSLSLYKMVVLPAASRPTIRMRISFLAKSRLKSFVNVNPMSSSRSLHGLQKTNIISTVGTKIGHWNFIDLCLQPDMKKSTKSNHLIN